MLLLRQLQRLMVLLNSNPEILETLGRTGLALRKMKASFEKASKIEVSFRDNTCLYIFY